VVYRGSGRSATGAWAVASAPAGRRIAAEGSRPACYLREPMLPVLFAMLLAAEERAPALHCSSIELSLSGIGSLEEDLARTAGLAGSAFPGPGLIRRPSGARPLRLCDGEPPPPGEGEDPSPAASLEWSIVPPVSLTRVLTGWSDDRNDGALWSGRGLSSSLSAGVRARWRWLTAQLAPLAAWQMNRPFALPRSTQSGLSPWANPFNFGTIDLPLRMGPSDFWTTDWGQSFVRADLGPFAAGLSTENLWWGPGIRNSLLLSNSAAGFPHLFLGTARPIDIGIGRLQAEAIWGRLPESRWFDADRGNDQRLFEGVSYAFAPSFAPHFTVAFSRVWVFPGTRVNRDVYLNPLVPPFLTGLYKAGRNGSENQLASLLVRWVLPGPQLELYGEWARDDFTAGLNHLFQDPWAQSAFQAGLQKLVAVGGGWIRVQAELTHTFQMPNAATDYGPVFYTHGTDLHGYTSGGQMIGAGLGPQGDTQFLAVDHLRGPLRLGGFAERTIRNERWYYDVIGPAVASSNLKRHDAELALGFRGGWARGEWDLTWELAGAHRYNPNFASPVTGLDATLRVAWWPGRTEAPALPAPARAAR